VSNQQTREIREIRNIRENLTKHVPLPMSFKGRDFVFGNFLTISADLKILKQPNHVKHLRIFSTIFEILKTLPLKAFPCPPSRVSRVPLVSRVPRLLRVPRVPSN
jgi:hypothetical protein